MMPPLSLSLILSILLATKAQFLTESPRVASTNDINVPGIGWVASVRTIDKSESSLIARRVISSCHNSNELVPGVSIIR